MPLPLLLASSLGAAPLEKIRVDERGFFVDERGRTRIFHGVNAVEKLAPFLPPLDGFDTKRTLSDRDAADLASWGMNVVRLGVLFNAVMPQPGVVNTSYLDAARATIRTLAAHGIYTLVDAHQDVMGARFCGEGFAEWAVQKALKLSKLNVSDPTVRFPAPQVWNMEIDPATGYPSRKACDEHAFGKYYYTAECSGALGAFFGSAEMHADFGEHWHAVATALAGEGAVLGYELLNEPFSPNVFTKDTELLPLYRAANDRIREADNRSIVFYEGWVGRSPVGNPSDFPAGGPGGVAYNDRQAYAYHIYCFNNTRRILEPVCDFEYELAWFAEQHSTLGGGRMLTEFGAVGEDPARARAFLLRALPLRLRARARASSRARSSRLCARLAGERGHADLHGGRGGGAAAVLGVAQRDSNSQSPELARREAC